MLEADERTIAWALFARDLAIGRGFVASPGKVIWCLDAEAPFAKRMRDETLTVSRQRGRPW
jgi:hypothetical protein